MDNDELLTELLEKKPPPPPPQPEQHCHATQSMLCGIFAESGYGVNQGLFLGYFDRGSQPPLCCVCHKAIGAHPDVVAKPTNVRIAPTVDSSPSSAPADGEAVVGTALGGGLADGAGPSAVAAEPFVIPPIPPADDASLFQHVAPPAHWHIDREVVWALASDVDLQGAEGYQAMVKARWAKQALFEVGGASADGVKYRCLAPVRDPSDGGALRPCGATVERKSFESHLAFQHQITEPPFPFNKGKKPDLKGRPWHAPYCPELKDCGVLCDCLLCPCCFCSRLGRAIDVKSKHGATFWVKTASPSTPVGVDWSGGCEVSGPFCCRVLGAAVFGLVFPCFWCDVLSESAFKRHRTDLIDLEAIDAWSHLPLACAPCALVQVHRELRSLGLNPGTSFFKVDPSTIADTVASSPSLATILAANPAADRMINAQQQMH